MSWGPSNHLTGPLNPALSWGFGYFSFGSLDPVVAGMGRPSYKRALGWLRGAILHRAASQVKHLAVIFTMAGVISGAIRIDEAALINTLIHRGVPPTPRPCGNYGNPTHGSGWIVQVQPTKTPCLTPSRASPARREGKERKKKPRILWPPSEGRT